MSAKVFFFLEKFTVTSYYLRHDTRISYLYLDYLHVVVLLVCRPTADHMPIFNIRNVCKVKLSNEGSSMARSISVYKIFLHIQRIKNSKTVKMLTLRKVDIMTFAKFVSIIISSFTECCPLEKINKKIIKIYMIGLQKT